MTNKPDRDRMNPPDFLTVEEAAAVLRLGRTSAYRQARLFLATNGAEGLCADRFGKQIRIPRCHLEQRLGGPLTWPINDHDVPDESPVTPTAPTPPPKRATRRATRPPDQDTLPFAE